MFEFENTIRINRPIAEVFAFLLDLENLSKWNYYVLEVRKRSDGPIRIGTIYHQVRKADEQDLRITELEPNHTLTVQTVPPSSPSLEMRFTLDAEADTTLFAMHGSSKRELLRYLNGWAHDESSPLWPRISPNSRSYSKWGGWCCKTVGK